MNRVVHFEIQADNPVRAMKFYEDVFGWKFEQWNKQEYWMIMTVGKGSKEPGINGGLLPRPAELPPTGFGTNAYVCTIEVDDFDKYAEKIVTGGGAVALSKYALPGIAWQGYFVDTEGNTFGVHQPDKNAK